MRKNVRTIVVLIGVLSLLSLPLVAIADESIESGDPGSVPADEPLVGYVYDSMFHVLVYGFNDPAPADPLDCTPIDPVTFEIDDEGQVTVIGGDLPAGCSALSVEGPNGQVNHGTFVSALAHAIRSGFDDDTPFGHYLREFAKSDLGKGDDHVKGTDGTEEPEPSEAEESSDGSKGKSGSAKGHSKKDA